MAFLPVECKAEQHSGNNGLVEMKESLYGFFSFAVAEAREWIPVTSLTDEKVLKVRILYKFMPIILSDIEKIGLKYFREKTG